MINEKTAIKIETSYSDDKKHRYLLYRSWDKNLPSACIIMLNPNSNSILESDVTSMLVLNNIVKLGYGSIRIVNRYSFITPKLQFKWQSDEILTSAENDVVIKQSADSSDTVILAWGSIEDNNKRVGNRIETILNSISSNKDKFRYISDGKKTGLHPLTPSLRKEWKLVPYERA